jgi:RNA polymerase sigma-70 factor (ECF subfamily)
MSAAIDLLRRRRARREESIDDAHAQSETPAVLRVASPDRSDDEALAHRLELALAQLPRNRRLCVQLHLEGYSRDEIASMTGWTEPKVRNLMYRGLDELRALLRTAAMHAP